MTNDRRLAEDLAARRAERHYRERRARELRRRRRTGLSEGQGVSLLVALFVVACMGLVVLAVWQALAQVWP